MYISNVRRLPDDRIVKINVYTQQPLAEVFFHMQMSYSRYANKNHDDKKDEFLRAFTDEHSPTEIADWKLNFWFYDKIISFDRLVHGDTCALPVLAGIDWALIWLSAGRLPKNNFVEKQTVGLLPARSIRLGQHLPIFSYPIGAFSFAAFSFSCCWPSRGLNKLTFHHHPAHCLNSTK